MVKDGSVWKVPNTSSERTVCFMTASKSSWDPCQVEVNRKREKHNAIKDVSIGWPMVCVGTLWQQQKHLVPLNSSFNGSKEGSGHQVFQEFQTWTCQRMPAKKWVCGEGKVLATNLHWKEEQPFAVGFYSLPTVLYLVSANHVRVVPGHTTAWQSGSTYPEMHPSMGFGVWENPPAFIHNYPRAQTTANLSPCFPDQAHEVTENMQLYYP